MPKLIKIASVFGLIIILLAIRFFQETLFYDPLIAYYKNGDLTASLPHYSLAKLIFSISLRYFVNSTISIVILVLIFSKNSILHFSIRFYLLLLSILLLLFLTLLLMTPNQTSLLFFIRRFLIQPLPLLLLIPAFYYQKMNEN